MAATMIRQVYGRALRLGRWLRAFWLPRVVQHGALKIVPDRLIGPELALWQDCLIDTLRRLPAASLPSAQLLLHDAAVPTSGPSMHWRIRFQPEHTLVKPGGSGAESALPSRTPIANTQAYYWFRLLHQERLQAADLILDYCDSNLRHWQESGQLPELLSRARVFAPLVLPISDAVTTRPHALVTLFSNPNVGRRASFLARAKAQGLSIRNATRAYSRARLCHLFDQTQVLINLRQTDHHDTLEALRVLPALARGVLVVSETVPLRESLPYHDCVIWADYEALPEVIADVHARYQHYWQTIFGSGLARTRLQALAEQNRQVLTAFFESPQRRTG